MPAFTVHTIGLSDANKLGQTSLADLDADGDLDFITGSRDGPVCWYEYQRADRWVRHVIGDNAATDVGGCLLDVDGDGDLDHTAGACWYQNPGPGDPTRRWDRFTNGLIATHDQLAADIDGDGRQDLVFMRDEAGLFWNRAPASPAGSWSLERIGPARHSGVAVGDLDSDGDNDVVRADWWFENVNAGVSWRVHRGIPFPGLAYNDFGMAPQCRLADLDSDGDPDCFSCEMEIGGGGRWFIWENPGGAAARGSAWQEHEILRGVSGHETRVGDVDADGDIDLCSKPWNGRRHVFVENLARQSSLSLPPNSKGSPRD